MGGKMGVVDAFPAQFQHLMFPAVGDLLPRETGIPLHPSLPLLTTSPTNESSPSKKRSVNAFLCLTPS